MKEVFTEVETNMKHAVDHFHHELKHLRTGRASLALLEGITVDYYGSPVPLNQVASLSVADATLIVAQPYDPSQSSAIERAIMKSDLGLNPSSDGKVIRIPVPSLTEERRKEIVKKAHDLAEHAKTAIRQARREGNDKLKKKEKDKEISQDDERRGLDDVQKLHDRYIGEVTSVLQKKEQQILEV
ncbi:MAG TPA: ribosome recycling factor [Thermoanaerobaculia bacterium]|nr:ribosome recycling factor [Thermoanaerobaculia bacterium]HSN87805.1 ribosome recycling factor [Thermoanaerobaculia bacterium]